MADPLVEREMKLQRAEEHFGELRRQHDEFIGRNPYRALIEDDPSRGVMPSLAGQDHRAGSS